MPHETLGRNEIAKRIQNKDWMIRNVVVDPALYCLVSHNGEWFEGGAMRGGRHTISTLVGDIMSLLQIREADSIFVWIVRENIDLFALEFNNIQSRDGFEFNINIKLQFKILVSDWKGHYTQTSINNGLVSFYQRYMGDSNVLTHQDLKEYVKDPVESVLQGIWSTYDADTINRVKDTEDFIASLYERITTRLSRILDEVLECRCVHSLTMNSPRLTQRATDRENLKNYIELEQLKAKKELLMEKLKNEVEEDKLIIARLHKERLERINKNPLSQIITPPSPTKSKPRDAIFYSDSQNSCNCGDYSQALEYIDEAIKLKPHSTYYDFRAIINTKLNDVAQAANDRRLAREARRRENTLRG